MKLVTFPITAARGALEMIGGIGLLLRDALGAAPKGLLDKRGRRLGWANLWSQMVRVGVNSIPIVSLVLLCIGSIISLQMAPVLQEYGMVAKVADVVAVAIFRELGPLTAAIVLTGYAGASIAAELGTMVVSEEIEAMDALGISPVRFLVLPRVLATTLMMVCLAAVADIMGMAGGLIVSQSVLGIDTSLYLSRTFDMLKFKDFATGLAKAGVFGAIISLLACHLGLNVTGGAQGVGVATTRTVVLTIVALIFVDLLFTGTFYFLNL